MKACYVFIVMYIFINGSRPGGPRALLNSLLVGMYQEKMCKNKSMHRFINMNILGHNFPSFGYTPSFGLKATKSFIHEAPGL